MWKSFWEVQLFFFFVCFLAELSDKERPTQQRLPGSLRQPLPVQLRPPLCNQNCVQWGHRRDAQHPKEIPPGRSPRTTTRHTQRQYYYLSIWISVTGESKITTACKWCSSSFNHFSYCTSHSSLPHFPLSSFGCLQFIVECHGNTLLPQFLGMYRLTVDGVETYMVVTRNVFSHRLTVHRKYDLKVGMYCNIAAYRLHTNLS